MEKIDRLRRARIEADQPQPVNPWELVWGQPYIDSERLAAAIERDLNDNPAPDFRARLLVRDAAKALQSFWGARRYRQWLTRSPVRARIAAICREKLGKPGFRYLRRRLVATPGKDQIEQVFELLGQRVHNRVEVHIAGSIPTLIKGLTHRPTDDIDFVNEVPAEIRSQRAVLNQLQTKFGLTLGHVQSHYLPANWQNRRQYFGDFGGLRVYLVDEYDVFVSKLSSNQEKHKDDLRVMAPRLDKEKVKERLTTDGKAFLENPYDRPRIEANWRFIYREPLFPETRPTAERKGPTKEAKKNADRRKKGR